MVNPRTNNPCTGFKFTVVSNDETDTYESLTNGTVTFNPNPFESIEIQ
jgi:hypothetical protein